MVVSWATGVQKEVEMQTANPTMNGFGSVWLSRAIWKAIGAKIIATAAFSMIWVSMTVNNSIAPRIKAGPAHWKLLTMAWAKAAAAPVFSRANPKEIIPP